MGKALIDIKRQKYILHPHFLSHTRCGNFGHSGRFKIESSFFWQLLALATLVLFWPPCYFSAISMSRPACCHCITLCGLTELVWDVVHSSAVVNWRGSGRRGENYQNKFTPGVRRRAVKVIEAGQGHSQVEWTEIWERFRPKAKWVFERDLGKYPIQFEIQCTKNKMRYWHCHCLTSKAGLMIMSNVSKCC